MNKSLKILMICHHRRNRARGRSQPLAQNLVQLGHNVSLIVIAEKRKVDIVESEWNGVSIIETPDLLWGRLRSGWDLWDLLNRIVYLNRDQRPYDILHCFETRPATIYPALFYLKNHKVPMLTDWNDWWGHGGLIDTNRPKWYRLLFGRIETYYEEAFRTSASGLTVISSALARRAIQLGVSEERICHLPGGVSPELIEYRSKEECRKKIGLPLSEPLIGYCGADQYLDIDIAIKALTFVAQKYPSVKMIITGNVSKSVKDLINYHGITNKFLFTGFLPSEDLSWYLGCSDVFVLPFPEKIYNIGRWPNKIGIYMSLGRPTVSNPVGDIKDLLEKNRIGLSAEWDPEDFAEKMIYLLENPEAADRLGKNARELAITKYNWRALVCQLEEFYYKLLDMERHR